MLSRGFDGRALATVVPRPDQVSLLVFAVVLVVIVAYALAATLAAATISI